MNQLIKKQLKTTRIIALVFAFVFGHAANFAVAQDGFDEEATPIFLKKIRDQDGNYLKELTRATAKELSSSGEFVAKPYKRNASNGPVIEVTSPDFSFAQHDSGMSTKEMADVGLDLVKDVGGLFGFDKEANKASEIQSRMHRNKSLESWGENEKIMVTMTSKVYLTDSQTGDRVTRTINQEKVFESKNHFLKAKDKMMQDSVIAAVKKAVVEYADDSDF